MGVSVSTGDVVNLFQKVYGELKNLQPEDYILEKKIPFSQKQKVGEAYIEAMVLTAETGWTLGGSALDQAFDINPAIAGAVQQTTVKPYMSVLGSVVPWGVLSRSATSAASFFDGTKHIVKNNLRSHGKLLEILRLYGQAAEGLGTYSRFTATYRTVSFTAGTGNLGGCTFVNSVDATLKAILVTPGQFAAGIWVGSEGAVIKLADTSNVVQWTGKLVAVDADNGIIYTDTAPAAAPASSYWKLLFDGMELARELPGIRYILTNTTTLFGISTSSYNLWKGVRVTLASTVAFTFSALQKGVAQAVNRGGLDGDLLVLVNPRTWGTLITTESAKRSYDKSYSSGSAENGMESIVFYTQAGKCEIMSHRMVKEGEVYALHMEDWSRSGSAEISFTVPGLNKEIIFPLENQAAMAFRSYSDQYIFNHRPACSIVFDGFNDEA